jgi:predicted helicase
LAAFDPTLRDDLGVWYTPREIVRYMVERVDRVLRDELGLASGLADERVHVLDPCCGTGAFLVEVLRRIECTLEDEGGGGLKGQRLRAAAMTRIHGFEIMPAPFVVAHLRVGAFLQGSQAPFAADGSQRASIYLTNALTGWSDRAERPLLPMPELADERDAAERVKHEEPILVIIGNPPYNAFAGTSPAQEEHLVDPYKVGLQQRWGIRKFNLDDLYIRFFRIAQRRIAAMTGRGVVCFISNHTWTTETSFVVMRELMLADFDRIWIDNMHGNRVITEYAPDGSTSETIFAVAGHSPGIRQGTAISLMAKTGSAEVARVLYFDGFNQGSADDRRAAMIESLAEISPNDRYEVATPDAANRFSFRPQHRAADYESWPRLIELCVIEPFSGLTEKRRHALIGIDRDVLETKMRRYLDPTVSFEQLVAENCGPVTAAARFEPKVARTAVVPSMPFDPLRLRRYAYMPFDDRWAYYLDQRPIWNEPRPALVRQMVHSNLLLTTRATARRSDGGAPISATTALPNDHLFDPNTRAIPIRLHESGLLEKAGRAGRANLSPAARRYLAEIGAGDPDAEPAGGAALWLHALAAAHAPAYLDEHRAAIVASYPRIPLPANLGMLTASATLGQRLADLLDPERRAKGVTGGPVLAALRCIGVPMRADDRQLTDTDNALAANWGYHDGRGAVMPGQGRAVERSSYDSTEVSAFAAGGPALNLASDEVVALLGETTYDVWLNGDAYWRNVPAEVWRFKIGGYQVIKKWLSYREHDLLGRPLRQEEVSYVQEMARRIAAILLMGPTLNASYAACKANPYSWLSA